MKCKNCTHRVMDWMTTYDGRGLIEFSYCNRDITSPKMVDPDVERECDSGRKKKKKVKIREVTHAS